MSLPNELQCGDCDNSQYNYTEVDGEPAAECPDCGAVLSTESNALFEALDERYIAENKVTPQV